MTVVDLTHTITDGMAGYPGDLPPRIKPLLSHDSDGMMASGLEMGCHVGTHVDVPLHFLRGRSALADIPLDLFCGRAMVLDAPATDPPSAIDLRLLEGIDLQAVEFLVFRTGWEFHWGSAIYYSRWPTLSPDLARVLAESGLKGVGLDAPSADRLGAREAHDLFAAAGMINIENLANLAALPVSEFDLFVLPLKLAGVEASPVRAVALLA